MQHMIQFSDTIRILVEVFDDYKVEGSFDPNAASDLDYYGYRDTQFDVVDVFELTDVVGYLAIHRDLLPDFLREHEGLIVLAVQDHLDEANAEAA